MEDDSLGYGVLSFDDKGQEKLIKVKAVNGKPSQNFRFFISSGEIVVARSEKFYHLYIVFDYFSVNPCIFEMPNPFKHSGSVSGVTIVPIKYMVLVEIKSNSF